MGWAMFAAIMLMIVGMFQAIAGLAGILENEFYVVGRNYVFEFDVTTWGVIHILIGLVLILSGVGIITGNVLARTVGVIAAAVSAVANFVWLPYYPVWSIAMIAVDVTIIWAVTAHGRDLARSA